MDKTLKIYKKLGFLWRMNPPFLLYSQCRFIPTCSEYAVESIKKHGPVKGVFRSFLRVLKCNPFSKVAIDQP